jgi:cell division protein FtsQ
MARETKKSPKPRWRLWMGIAMLTVCGVSTAIAGLQVRQFAMSSPRFRLSREHPGSLTVEGLRYTSRAKVQRVFANDFARSIFGIPLAERRRRLLAIDWVEDASVSRIWPDRVVVRLRERKPVAFVWVRSGILLIDAAGVLLDQPAQAQFAFPVLRGIRDDEPESRRRDRVRAFLELQRDMGPLLKDISEINVSDPDNLRVVAHVDNRTLELTLGNDRFARRYRNFINHYPEIRKRSPGSAFDLRLNDRITATATDRE